MSAEFKSACVIDSREAGKAMKYGNVDVYDYGKEAVAPYEGTNTRTLFAEKPIVFVFDGLPKGEDFQVKASFLSDADRTMAIDANSTEFEPGVKVPKGELIEKTWTLPSSRLYDGKLSLSISCVSGRNAVIQRLEILTADGKELKPGIKQEFQEATQEELEKLVIDFPRLTPRPASVQGVKDALMSLNGTWEFSPEADAPFKPIEVPGEWKMQGFTVPEGAWATYKRSIDIPADWKGKILKLRFDAVHAVCEVTLNGQSVGGHEGGFVPFELDVTKAAKPGKNELVVKVQSESVADKVSCISQYASHQVGGIIRKVTLIAVPDVYVASENNHTSFDPLYTKPTFIYDAEIANTTDKSQTATLTGTLKDADGKVVVDKLKTEITVAPGQFQALSLESIVPDAKLWTSETPYLYTWETSLSVDGKEISTRSMKVGLRQVDVKGNQVFVNGKPVKLLAVDRHEVHPLRGRSLTPELCRKDAELYRKGNCNMIRTSHYPPSEEFLEACDELGLFVESEAAVCWIQHHASPIWQRWNYLDPKYFPYFLRPTFDQVAAYRNHPSIIMWSVCNESRWSSLWEKVLNVAKRHEKTRPFLFHDQCFGGFNNYGSTMADIANHHYPSENNSSMWSEVGRPVWFGEYAHLQCYNRRELVTDSFIQEDWSRPLQRMVDLMWEQPGCLGGAIWSGIDDVFHLPDGNIVGYGHWGPIDGWRREKPEHHGMKMAYTPFRVFDVVADPGKPIVLNVQNRQNFTDLADTKIDWVSGDKKGTVKTSLAPHAKGKVVIDHSFADGDEVFVTVTDPRGCLIGQERIVVGTPKVVAQEVKAAPLKLNPETGALDALGIEIPAPLPMMLALNGEGGASGPAGSVIANEIETFTPVNAWTWAKDASKENSYTGSADWGKGTLTYIPQQDGSLKVEYTLTAEKDVNPRQWGLVFTLPRAFDTISWDRKSHWSWYPQDQIGRPQGSAKANPVTRKFVEEPGVEQKGAWMLDANDLGTKDFRSTKANVYRAELSDGKGNKLVIKPADGKTPDQSVRAWVDGDTVRLLVAAFNTGGSDPFFGTHYSAERRPLKAGDTVKGSFILIPEKN